MYHHTNTSHSISRNSVSAICIPCILSFALSPFTVITISRGRVLPEGRRPSRRGRPFNVYIDAPSDVYMYRTTSDRTCLYDRSHSPGLVSHPRILTRRPAHFRVFCLCKPRPLPRFSSSNQSFSLDEVDSLHLALVVTVLSSALFYSSIYYSYFLSQFWPSTPTTYLTPPHSFIHSFHFTESPNRLRLLRRFGVFVLANCAIVSYRRVATIGFRIHSFPGILILSHRQSA